MLNTMLKNILMLTSLSVALLPQVSMANTPIEKLVEPIALYPDALLAQILPASTNPIQIVEAARYLRTQGDDVLSSLITAHYHCPVTSTYGG